MGSAETALDSLSEAHPLLSKDRSDLGHLSIALRSDRVPGRSRAISLESFAVRWLAATAAEWRESTAQGVKSRMQL